MSNKSNKSIMRRIAIIRRASKSNPKIHRLIEQVMAEIKRKSDFRLRDLLMRELTRACTE